MASCVSRPCRGTCVNTVTDPVVVHRMPEIFFESLIPVFHIAYLQCSKYFRMVYVITCWMRASDSGANIAMSSAAAEIVQLLHYMQDCQTKYHCTISIHHLLTPSHASDTEISVKTTSLLALRQNGKVMFSVCFPTVKHCNPQPF